MDFCIGDIVKVVRADTPENNGITGKVIRVVPRTKGKDGSFLLRIESKDGRERTFLAHKFDLVTRNGAGMEDTRSYLEAVTK